MAERRKTSDRVSKASSLSRSRERLSTGSDRQQRSERRQRRAEDEEEKEPGRSRRAQRPSTERAPNARPQRRVRIEAEPEEESKSAGVAVKESSSSSTFVQGTPPGGRLHLSREHKQRLLAARSSGVVLARRRGRHVCSESESGDEQAEGGQSEAVLPASAQ